MAKIKDETLQFDVERNDGVDVKATGKDDDDEVVVLTGEEVLLLLFILIIKFPLLLLFKLLLLFDDSKSSLLPVVVFLCGDGVELLLLLLIDGLLFFRGREFVFIIFSNFCCFFKCGQTLSPCEIKAILYFQRTDNIYEQRGLIKKF